MADKRITLDGKVLDNPDRYGDWGVHSFEGWWDSPAEKEESSERPNQDGDYDLEVQYQSRYPTLTGIFIAHSHSLMFDGMNVFSALLRTRGRLIVSGYGPDQWADVKRASGLTITPQTDRVCLWQARLKAPDARKFGDLNTFRAAVDAPTSVFHRGSYGASPKITVKGSMPGGYTIGLDGWDYRVTVPLVNGTPHVIDYNDGHLRINGVIRQNSLGNTNVTTVPPGKIVGFGLYSVTTGTGTADMEILDTYI